MHVVILGNGIAGITAARHLRKRDAQVRITVVSGESDHHFSRPALMYVYMGHMRYRDTLPYPEDFWAKSRIELVRGWVEGVDTGARELRFTDGRRLGWDALLLATGSTPNRFGWPGQDLDRVQGLYSLQDLIALERCSRELRHAVIVGGGLIGIELAEMLHSRHKTVTLLVREPDYWTNVLPPEEAALISRAIRAEGFDLRLETELDRIEDDGRGGVGAVLTRDGERIPCQFVGLTAGVRPNLSALQGSGLATGRGVLVDAQLRTEVEGVFAAGDCAEIRLPDGSSLLQQVWYTGRAQGEVAAENLLGGERVYQPGTWFNSAKFLDIEYQVYGRVPNGPQAGVEQLYWEHGSGRKALRLVHEGGRFVGVNLLGLRFRQRVCEAWIEEGRSIAYVLDHLADAAFDPELHQRHEAEIRAALRGRLAS